MALEWLLYTGMAIMRRIFFAVGLRTIPFQNWETVPRVIFKFFLRRKSGGKNVSHEVFESHFLIALLRLINRSSNEQEAITIFSTNSDVIAFPVFAKNIKKEVSVFSKHCARPVQSGCPFIVCYQ